MSEVTITKESHPQIAQAFEKDCGFIQDLNSGLTTNLNGKPILIAEMNLMLAKTHLRLWVKLKMKPNKSWKISDCKKYFGFTGHGDKLLDQLSRLDLELQSLKK